MRKGIRNTRLYRIWLAMKNRCQNEKNLRYKDYGGRGIKVCNEWRNDFQTFYDWAMSNGYSDDLTIDRIDNNGNYEPSNCRWITTKEQNNNSRRCHVVEWDGEKHNITEWSKILGIPRHVLSNRLTQYDYSVERAFTETIGERQGKRKVGSS